MTIDDEILNNYSPCSHTGYNESCYTGAFFVSELPEIGDINRVYVNITDNTIWHYVNNQWVQLGGSGLSFSDLVSILQEGDNVTLDIDNLNQTITINSSGGGIVTYIRRSDYVLLDRKSYIGIAPNGSLETEAVWTIWVTITNSSGEVVSNIQYINKKWSERGLL